MNGNKKEASVCFHAIDLTEDSNFQRLEHNTSLHLFIQIIIEGDSDILRRQFENSKKHNYFKFLDVKKAIALNHSFSK
jgi:short-subunit dehydrogenase